MHPHNSATPQRLLTFLTALLVLKVTASVVSNYPNYIPPNFSSDFLHGRSPYFWGPYHWAFYIHILSGPLTLILGLFLVWKPSRTRFPAWHRLLGRLQVALVLLLVTPSGLWMSFHAAAGPIAAVSLATLSLATALCAFLGLRAALSRRFVDHRLWMWRCYLLLGSAVLLRLIGGLATVTGFTPTWLDPLAAWLSWLLPLTVFEFRRRIPSLQALNTSSARSSPHHPSTSAPAAPPPVF